MANDRWYFTKEQLEATPSRKCGFDSHKELSNRQQAANFIQDMGQRLKVSQLCINTAIVYMHRFYVFHSFTHFPWHQMAAAALFLAAKVEEQPRKLEYVIRVANICKNSKDTNIDVNSERYIIQSQNLVFNENVLLQTLGFDVAIDHPHTHVVRCCHLVRASKDLAQTSYFMASNSLHLTTMCIQYRPTVVACFCILVACKWSNWEIPLSNEKKEWYTYVDASVTADLLQQLTEEFLVIFEKCPSRLKEKIMAIADNVNHIPNHHINSPFDTDPKKIIVKDEKDGHSHRSEDPHKHRPSRPTHDSTGQHSRDRQRDRGASSTHPHPHHHPAPPQQQKVAPPPQQQQPINASSTSTTTKPPHHHHHNHTHQQQRIKMPPAPPPTTRQPIESGGSNKTTTTNAHHYHKQRPETTPSTPQIHPKQQQQKNPVVHHPPITHSSYAPPPPLPPPLPQQQHLHSYPPQQLQQQQSIKKPPSLFSPTPPPHAANDDLLLDGSGGVEMVEEEEGDVGRRSSSPIVRKMVGCVKGGEEFLVVGEEMKSSERRSGSRSHPPLEPTDPASISNLLKEVATPTPTPIRTHPHHTQDSSIGGVTITTTTQVPPPPQSEISINISHTPHLTDNNNKQLVDEGGGGGGGVDQVSVSTPILLPPISSSSSHHKSKKKNKEKHKHKHKERSREERGEKKKKYKEKDRDRDKERREDLGGGVVGGQQEQQVQIVESLKLKIPKDKIIPVKNHHHPHYTGSTAPPTTTTNQPQQQQQGLKIKIPKHKINTENITSSAPPNLASSTTTTSTNPPIGGLKLKIPKEKLNNFEPTPSSNRKRDRSSPTPHDAQPPSKQHKSSSSKNNGRYSNKVSGGDGSENKMADYKYFHKTSTS